MNLNNEVITANQSQGGNMTASSNNINATFGIFVGFYNRANGTNWSVNEAAKDNGMVELFTSTMSAVSRTGLQLEVRTSTSRPSTKRVSLDEFRAANGNRVGIRVLNYIESSGGDYRASIAKALGLRISTVCARVNELKAMGLIESTGTTVDPVTNKSVEVVTLAV